MKYLITGITGFVGPHLASILLEEGHEVWGLIRGSNGRELDLLDVLTSDKLKKIKWIYGDLTDYSAISRIFQTIQFDGVFHLAAQSHPPTSFTNPIQTFKTNAMGSVHLISCIADFQSECRLHFCSSSEVYGDGCRQGEVLTEESPISPINPYGVSKASIDLYVQERIRNDLLKGFITRAFSHTGPRRGYNFSISSDAYQIAKMVKGLQGKRLLIGNLDTERVVMDVRDCAWAYYLLMKDKCEGIYNISGETAHKMEHYTDKLIELSGLKGISKKIHKPFWRPIDIQVQMSSNERIQKDTDWAPMISTEQMLQDLLNYWIRRLSK
jgi:GDPmannose 4,6-dehydratase